VSVWSECVNGLDQITAIIGLACFLCSWVNAIRASAFPKLNYAHIQCVYGLFKLAGYALILKADLPFSRYYLCTAPRQLLVNISFASILPAVSNNMRLEKILCCVSSICPIIVENSFLVGLFFEHVFLCKEVNLMVQKRRCGLKIKGWMSKERKLEVANVLLRRQITINIRTHAFIVPVLTNDHHSYQILYVPWFIHTAHNSYENVGCLGLRTYVCTLHCFHAS